jgi:hypothetical protein
MNLTNYKKEDATHYLSCRHAIGRNGIDYFMACIILKKMLDNRLKILVFGERNWKGHDDKKQIKYVDDFRVKPKSDFKRVGKC